MLGCLAMRFMAPFLNRQQTYYTLSSFFNLSEIEQQWKKKMFITHFIDKYATKIECNCINCPNNKSQASESTDVDN